MIENIESVKKWGKILVQTFNEKKDSWANHHCGKCLYVYFENMALTNVYI